MGKYIKLFNTHAGYAEYIGGSNKILPNVSYCEDNNEVHYNPWVETKLVCKYNITNTSSATALMANNIPGDVTIYYTEMEIDGVVQPSVVTSYTFDTTGEHIVKYTLADPTFIGQNAFYNCKKLTSVTIPNSVTTIGNNAFQDCTGLTSVTIPNSVTTIGNNAFQNCTGLTSVTIPNSVTSIGEYTFQAAGLTSVTIGNSVTNIGFGAFDSCSGLTNITSLAITAPTITIDTFQYIKTDGTLTVPTGSTGYDVWMGTGNYYLGKYNWTKVEQ